MRAGTKVIKNPETWLPNEFDVDGRGQGIGYVVIPPYPLGRDQYQIVWNGTRYFEYTNQIIRLSKKTLLILPKDKMKRLKRIISECSYQDRCDLVISRVDVTSDYNHRFRLLIEAHDIFDLIRMPMKERKKFWLEHKLKLREQSKVYKLKPVKEGRDNKGVLVGSGYGGSSSIRYPKKGHKNAWKQFYKLFPSLKPGFDDQKQPYQTIEIAKILSKTK